MESNSACNRPRSGSPICLITSMITDRIGCHEVLLPINHTNNKIRERKRRNRTGEGIENSFICEIRFENYNKILESDWLSPAMIINRTVGQCNWTVYASCLSNWTVRVRACALMDELHLNKLFLKTYFANKTVVYSFSGTFSPFSFSNFVIDMINW